MNTVNLQPVHTLEIPLVTLPLLVPSACVAEVTDLTKLTSIPFHPEWMVGIMSWRGRPVPVVSMDTLMRNGVYPAGTRSRVVIFYPLAGCQEWEFFGMLASAEPQSRTIDASALQDTVDIPDNTYIAAAIKLGRTVVGIPDLDALKTIFYPD